MSTKAAKAHLVMNIIWPCPGQAAWIEFHMDKGQAESTSSMSILEEGHKPASSQLRLLGESVGALELCFNSFEQEARALGWNVDVVNIKGGSVRMEIMKST